jgi:REP element-mobilizing transposase RayT
VAPSSISSIVRSYKSAVSKNINGPRQSPHVPVWHRNYYEHVMRDEEELNSIREYIQFNPQKWPEDEENQ